MFQFPSNGKAYPKAGEKLHGPQTITVFQFPSNGKAYPKKDIIVGVEVKQNSFNSLQTGKRIQSRVIVCACDGAVLLVSIPFKRESVSKVNFDGTIVEWLDMFQFPSNGKAYPKSHFSWMWADG